MNAKFRSLSYSTTSLYAKDSNPTIHLESLSTMINFYRYDGVQALRFIAAAMVLVTHSFFYASERLGTQESYSWSAGAKGVDIFFIISGFVMVLSSSKLISLDYGWKEFLRHRLIRIVPPYWAATTLKLIVLLLMSSFVLHAELDWWVIIKSYFFIPSPNVDGKIKTFLGVGWTLVYEMFFYTIFVVAMFFKKNIYIFVGIVLLLFSSLYLIRPETYSALWFLMDPIILEFYMGMVLGYFVLNRNFLPAFISVLVIFVSLFYLFFSENLLGLHRFIEAGIPAMFLVWSVVSLEKYLQNRIPPTVMFLGAASYVLYLFHPLIAPLAPTVLKKVGYSMFPVSVILSIILAVTITSIIHQWFEKPATLFLKRITPNVSR